MSVAERTFTSMYQREHVIASQFKSYAETDRQAAERLIIRFQRMLLEMRAIDKGFQR